MTEFILRYLSALRKITTPSRTKPSRFNSPQTTERESFEKQFKELIKIYEKDDKFLTQIKSLGGKDAHILALDFLKEHTLQKELPQKNLHRGFER